MSHRRVRAAALAASVFLALTALAGCAPGARADVEHDAARDLAQTQTPTPIATRTPGATPTAQAQIPSDCREILTDGRAGAARRHPAQRSRLRTIGQAGRRQPGLRLGVIPRPTRRI